MMEKRREDDLRESPIAIRGCIFPEFTEIFETETYG